MAQAAGHSQEVVLSGVNLSQCERQAGQPQGVTP